MRKYVDNAVLVMFRRRFLILAAWLIGVLYYSCSHPEPGLTGPMPVVFYNVENLYDTMDDPRVNDQEFLPGSDKEWTQERYRKKLQDIAGVLVEAGKGNLPAFIGMCEVENQGVLKDLISTGDLAKGDYGIVHFDGSDSRGIDLAFIYLKDVFRVTESRLVPVRSNGNTIAGGREMLYISGKTSSGEEIHFFVCHWTSRASGVRQSEGRRVEAAKTLREQVNLILQEDNHAKIVIAGDLNDLPDDKSISEILGARHPDNSREGDLVNLMYPAYSRGEGSYNYQGRWDMLDHIIVSSAVLSGPGCRVKGGEGYLHKSRLNTFSHPRGMDIPDRTYSGNRYLGGISDHFPVVAFLGCQTD